MNRYLDNDNNKLLIFIGRVVKFFCVMVSLSSIGVPQWQIKFDDGDIFDLEVLEGRDI